MNIEALSAELVRDEKEKLRLYKDESGNWTIGVGRNLSADGISHDEAMYMLKNDIVEKLNQLDRQLAWWRTLDEVRQRVLANMCFNLGIEGLLGFRKMIAALIHGDYETAAEEMAASEWAKQVGERAVRLVAMMRTGRVGVD